MRSLRGGRAAAADVGCAAVGVRGEHGVGRGVARPERWPCCPRCRWSGCPTGCRFRSASGSAWPSRCYSVSATGWPTGWPSGDGELLGVAVGVQATAGSAVVRPFFLDAAAAGLVVVPIGGCHRPGRGQAGGRGRRVLLARRGDRVGRRDHRLLHPVQRDHADHHDGDDGRHREGRLEPGGGRAETSRRLTSWRSAIVVWTGGWRPEAALAQLPAKGFEPHGQPDPVEPEPVRGPGQHGAGRPTRMRPVTDPL